MPSGSGIAAHASAPTPNTGAIALTLAAAKFAYLNTASVPRLPAIASASRRLRVRGSSAAAIRMPIHQLKATDASTNATYGASPHA